MSAAEPRCRTSTRQAIARRSSRASCVGLNAKLRKLKRILPRLLLGEVPATEEDLRKIAAEGAAGRQGEGGAGHPALRSSTTPSTRIRSRSTPPTSPTRVPPTAAGGKGIRVDIERPLPHDSAAEPQGGGGARRRPREKRKKKEEDEARA